MKAALAGYSLALSLLLVGGLKADDWTQWRGPNRADISSETAVLKEWPEGGPKQLWMNTDSGLGYGGIAVVEGVLYTVGARGDSEYVIAVDANTGEEKWRAEMGPLLNNGWGDGPRSTPTVDGNFIYAMGAQGYVVCISKEGEKKWTRQLSEFGAEEPRWGFAESPLVDVDKVVVSPGGTESSIVALNKIDGEVIWKSENLTDGDKETKDHYSSIVIAKPNGQKQYVQLMEQTVVGLDPETGKTLWTHPWEGSVAVIPTPVVRDNYVYITSGYGAGSMLLEIGDDNSVKEVYRNKVMKNHHGGVILVGDFLYGFSDGAGWMCQDFMSGESMWETDEFLGKGCLTCVDGMFLALDEKSGEVVMFEASDVRWKEHGRFQLGPLSEKRSRRGGIWTHPVVSGGKLYLKDQENLFCYDISE